MKRTLFQKIQISFIHLLAKVHWRQPALLTDADKALLKQMLAKDYYIIATRRSNYLTTFCICLGHWFLTGHWGFYSHVLMNLEDEVKTDSDFRFIEATGRGTHFSTFEQVFGTVDAVGLIKPRNMTLEEWTEALDRAKTYLGRPYDNLFDLKSDREINCVELVRLALSAIPDYQTKFADFERIIKKYKKLTPQMFVECKDFHVVWSVSR